MATPSGAYMPYFFLSSTPEEEEISVERFYHDLSSEVPKWARNEGHEVSYRGRVAAGILEAYESLG